MNILHLCNTALAGAPVHLSTIINKYTEHKSRCILKRTFSSAILKNLQWNYDITNPNSHQINQLVNGTDIIHFHNKPYLNINVKSQRTLLQFHGQPQGYIPNVTFRNFNGKKLVISQYHPRFYTDALIVPNMIDIWDEKHSPLPKNENKVKIFFGYASELKKSWADKGVSNTQDVLNRIKNKYKDKVIIKIVTNTPYEKCLQEKRDADIVIDACSDHSKSFHLSSLEGCSVGALVINSMDDVTFDFMKQISQTDSHPFIICEPKNLENKLQYYINKKDKLREKQTEARQWMETYWDPKILVKYFIRAYENLMKKGVVS